MSDTTNIPLVDLGRQYAAIGSELEAAILDVLRTTRFVAGPRVAAFEQEFAMLHDTTHGVAVNSGTAALHLALWALGIGPGDEVILPVNTYIATAEAVSLCGATPVFADHNDYFNIDVPQIEALITERTKAVIAVHLYGQPACMERIVEICEKKDLILLEDCAQSHLAEYQGKKTGSFGAAGCFSFYPGKNLGACGEAGAVVTGDASLAATMQQLKQHGVSDNKYYHHRAGHNYRMEELQAAALRVKLNYIAQWTDLRRQHANTYREMLSGVGDLVTPEEMPGVKHVYHLFVVRTERRDDLLEHLRANGIGADLHYPTPLHLQPAYASLGYTCGAFPVAEKNAKRILSLPMFPELTHENIARVCDLVRDFYNA
jgi:dTDP-4-amino-4,6-dideoxygalactose transaminase